MSHIAEGLLHAHLDGALGPDDRDSWTDAATHLELCADCRRRLDEARELREAAGALLAGASVASPPRPAFEDIVAVAEARRRSGATADSDVPAGRRASGRSGRTRPAVPWWSSPARLAWAASLVLAVGAGWIGRELMIEQGEPLPRLAAEADVDPASRATETQGLAAPAASAPDAAFEDSDQAAGSEEDRAPPPARRLEREALADAEAPAEARVQEQAAARARDEVAEARDEAAGARDDARDVGEGAELEERVRADGRVGADAPVGAGEPAVRGFAAKGDGTTCFMVRTVPAEAANRQQLGQADDGRRNLDGAGIDFPGVLRLELDGTARLETHGRPLVGFWTAADSTSRNVRVTDGATWYELQIEETEAGWQGNVLAADQVGRTVRLDEEACS